MSAEGSTRNLRCGSAVQDLVEPSDKTKVNNDWGEELGGLIKEVLRRRVRAPRWGWEDAEADPVQVEGDNEVQLGGEEELRNQSRDALEVSREPSVSLAGKTRDGSLSRNSLQLDTLQEANGAGQDHVEGDTLGGQDLLQTGDRPDLNLTPVQDQNGGPALPVSPVQPEAIVSGNEDLAGEEFLQQEQSLSRKNDLQAEEEAHVSEFALLVGCLFLFCLVVHFFSLMGFILFTIDLLHHYHSVPE